MNLKNISFMNEQLTSNNIENDEFTLNTEESDYKNLITRLKEIKRIIALLEKISKTKGCLFNEIRFLLGIVFIKNIKFI